MTGDLGFTLRAAAISWSWFTSSVMDSRSSGLTLSMAPRAEAACARPVGAEAGVLGGKHHLLCRG